MPNTTYTITITKIAEEPRRVHTAQGIEERDTPVATTLYEQTVDSIDLIAIISAINKVKLVSA
jgi:hypothetical protein